MPSLLGIDSGLTVTKAVLFDETGRQLAVARRRVSQLLPEPRHVERDMAGLWQATAEAIREVMRLSGRPQSDVAAVAATAHGDGLYLLDRHGAPLGPGILSLDSRAGELASQWCDGEAADAMLHLTGQLPHASAPSSLLGWIERHQPERYARIGHILSCKDWLRYCLTGTVGTDLTEASTSFTDVRTQQYSREALDLFGLQDLAQALPPAYASDAIAGYVTEDAARRTGLLAGTPVVAGLHDVTASALGIGGYGEGIAAVIAGTYSINETLTLEPKIDPSWFCRNGIQPGEWNAMAISPASTTNYDWFLDRLCAAERQARGQSIHDLLVPEIEAAFSRASPVMFHPYLFGSPYGSEASAGFFGLNGWHERGDMLRAVLEGIAFNHRIHVDALKGGFPLMQARLTGGVSRNPLVAQLFADVLAMPVTVTQTEEAAAWGAALCAGAGVGLFASPLADPRDKAAIERVYRPDPGRILTYQQRFDVFCDLADAMKPIWRRLQTLG
ncbi:carbohydrate kinase [Allorhizobium sp. BGMRC 0089]|uniref:FGGY-family carbohydrate kinase n=1 Tax=Allorhizobium sonneratiae TaxID=2934936 RepID=UPI0020338AD4|nr:carbohydrate kinase [Allorhizobium sonneratiae]